MLLGEDEARKLYNEAIEVVETTPFILEVSTPELADILFELIRLVLEDTPSTILVIVLRAEARELEFTKLAVVVDITPFTLLVNMNELVEVETVKVLLFITLLVATTPFMVVVKVLPLRV